MSGTPTETLVAELETAERILHDKPCEVYGLKQTCAAARTTLTTQSALIETLTRERDARLRFNLGDPITVRPGYKYGEWVGAELWFAGVLMGDNGQPSVWVSDVWPLNGNSGLTDGFHLDDIDHRALKSA